MVMIDWLVLIIGTSEEDDENMSYNLSCWSDKYECVEDLVRP